MMLLFTKEELEIIRKHKRMPNFAANWFNLELYIAAGLVRSGSFDNRYDLDCYGDFEIEIIDEDGSIEEIKLSKPCVDEATAALIVHRYGNAGYQVDVEDPSHWESQSCKHVRISS